MSLSGSVNHKRKEKNKKKPRGLGNLTYLLVHLALGMMYVVDFVERKKKILSHRAKVTRAIRVSHNKKPGVDVTVPSTKQAHH